MPDGFLKRLWRAFRRDNGDADPVMTVLSVALSAVLTTAVAGSLAGVVLVGSGYVTGQVSRSSLQQAQQLWASDMQDASLVTITGTNQVVIYNFPDDAPGIYQVSGQDDTCVKTTWSLSGTTMTAVVQRWNNADCDRSNPAAIPTSTITAATIPSFNPVTITASNVAGRDLHFDGSGNEVGLTSGTPSLQSQNVRPPVTVASTQGWTSTTPKSINLTGSVATPTGSVAVNFLGTTSFRPNISTVGVNTGLFFTPMTMARLYAGTVGTTAVTIPVAGVTGVPATAVAVVLNVEVNAPTAAGTVRLTPAGTPATLVTQAFATGVTSDNLTTVQLSGGKVQAILSAGSSTLDLDVEGYYSADGTASSFTPMANVRTMSAVAVTTAPTKLTFAGVAGIPANATAVAVNVQVTTSSIINSARMLPFGATDAGVATVNYQSAVAVADSAIVPLAGGAAQIRTNAGTATVNIDVVGYYSVSATGSVYVPVTIQRAWTGALSTTPAVIPVANTVGIPGNVVAVVANFEVVNPSVASYFRVTPFGADPAVTTQNYATAQTVSGMASTMTASGEVQMRTLAGTVPTAYMDVFGYFQPQN